MLPVRGRLKPLSVPAFPRLLGSYTVNETGDSVGIVALALLVYERTHDVAPTAAFFVAAKFLPAIVSPVVTARVDRLALRWTLPALYVAEALIFAALALVAAGTFFLPLVLVLGFMDGTLALTGRSLTRGAVAAVLKPPGLLREGNALMNIGFAVATVGGSALAGLLVAVFGLSTALLVDAASFLVIAVMLSLTRGLPAVEVTSEGWGERLRAGVAFARDNLLVRVLLAGQALAMVLFTLIIPIEVFYARETLGTTSAGFGVLLAAWGAGIVLGSVAFLALKHRSTVTLIMTSTSAIGLAYLGMSVADTLSVACLLSVLGGAGNGVQWIAVMTALQEATPEPLQARVAGFLESIGAAMPGVGYIIGGAITSLTSPRAAYAVAGGGTIALVVIMGLLSPRVRSRLELRSSDANQPPTAVVVDALLATGSRAAEPDLARE